MKIRNLAIAVLAVLAVGTTGCELYGKYDMRFSVWNWNQIDAGDCLAIGTYVMGVDLGSPPARAKAQIKIKPEFKEDRDFLPLGLTIRYTQTRLLSTILQVDVPFELKNGKGKYQFILPSLTFQEGDEIDVEACPTGEEGTFVPDDSAIDFRLGFKFDRVTW